MDMERDCDRRVHHHWCALLGLHHHEVGAGDRAPDRHDLPDEAPARLHLAARLRDGKNEGRHADHRPLAHQVCGEADTRHHLHCHARHHSAALPRGEEGASHALVDSAGQAVSGQDQLQRRAHHLACRGRGPRTGYIQQLGTGRVATDELVGESV